MLCVVALTRERRCSSFDDADELMEEYFGQEGMDAEGNSGLEDGALRRRWCGS